MKNNLDLVKTANLNDKVLLTDGSVLRFIKLNRPKTKFYARDDNDEWFECSIATFVRVTEAAPPESALVKALKNECRKWFRIKGMLTGFGPSDVIGFREDEEFVKLKEFGEERYDLSLEHFIQEVVQYHNPKIHLNAIEPGSIYSLELTSCGNPDYGQNPLYQKMGALVNRTVGVNSLEEASVLCRKFIEDGELGSGHWSGGKVVDLKQGCQVAHISYNGRIWLTDKDGKVLD